MYKIEQREQPLGPLTTVELDLIKHIRVPMPETSKKASNFVTRIFQNIANFFTEHRKRADLIEYMGSGKKAVEANKLISFYHRLDDTFYKAEKENDKDFETRDRYVTNLQDNLR